MIGTMGNGLFNRINFCSPYNRDAGINHHKTDLVGLRGTETHVCVRWCGEICPQGTMVVQWGECRACPQETGYAHSPTNGSTEDRWKYGLRGGDATLPFGRGQFMSFVWRYARDK